jgi:hypothetical protein
LGTKTIFTPVGDGGYTLCAAGAPVRRSLLGEEGWAGWVVPAREGLVLIKVGFSEELSDALRSLVHLNGMYLGLCAALAHTAWRTSEGSRPTGGCTGATVDLAHAKTPTVKHG